MRILQVDMGPLWRGGQRQCFLLCRDLTRAGAEVHLVHRPGAPLGQHAAGWEILLHPLPAWGELDLFAAARLARLLRSCRPHLVAAHEAHGWGLLALARGLSGISAPLVYHRRVDVPLRPGAGTRWKMRRTDLYICVSRAVAQVLRRSGAPEQRIRVVPSGTPGHEEVPGARAAVRAELGLSGDSRLAGVVAGLLPHKGHRVLLSAFWRLAPRHPALHLLIVGDGPLRGRLERQIAELELGDRVHLLGERQDIGRLLSALDLFVLPSLTEGLGSGILDAFSLGLPVVASRAGGIPEIVVDDETGRLVEPDDADALAAVIDRMLRNPDEARRLGWEGQRRHRDCFTEEAMSSATQEHYRTLVGAWGGGASPSRRNRRTH